MAMKVYQYAIPRRLNGKSVEEAYDPGGVILRQLRIANRQWNALVEIEQAHRARVAEIWLRYPQIQAAQSVVDEALAESSAAQEELKAYRKASRTTKPAPEVKARVQAARQALALARAGLKAAKEAVGEQAKAELSENKQARAALQKASRQEFTGEHDLFWATSNDIHQRRFPAAVERAYSSGGELRFHRFDGTGTLTAQLQHQAGDPQATPQLLANGGGKWRNVLQLSPWRDPGERPRGSERFGRLRLRIGGKHDPVITELPVIIHRWLPADANVKEVKLSRRRIAGHYRLYAAIVFEVPDAQPKHDGAVVDVDFRWAHEEVTGLRVARIASDRPDGWLPEPPEGIAPFITKGDWHEAWLPNTWKATWERGEAIRKDRDDNLNRAKLLLADELRGNAALVSALAEEAAGEAALREAQGLRPRPAICAENVMKWRSAGRMAAFTIRLRDAPELRATAPVLTDALEAWRKRDRHLWEFEAHERDQLVAWRNDVYAKIAAWLADASCLIGIRDLPVAKLRRRPEENEDSYQGRGGRGNLQLAAPSTLKAAIINAARQRGTEIRLIATEES